MHKKHPMTMRRLDYGLPYNGMIRSLACQKNVQQESGLPYKGMIRNPACPKRARQVARAHVRGAKSGAQREKNTGCCQICLAREGGPLGVFLRVAN